MAARCEAALPSRLFPPVCAAKRTHIVCVRTAAQLHKGAEAGVDTRVRGHTGVRRTVHSTTRADVRPALRHAHTARHTTACSAAWRPPPLSPHPNHDRTRLGHTQCSRRTQCHSCSAVHERALGWLSSHEASLEKKKGRRPRPPLPRLPPPALLPCDRRHDCVLVAWPQESTRMPAHTMGWHGAAHMLDSSVCGDACVCDPPCLRVAKPVMPAAVWPCPGASVLSVTSSVSVCIRHAIVV